MGRAEIVYTIRLSNPLLLRRYSRDDILEYTYELDGGGLYFLFDREELVYVGQSSHLFDRIHNHLHSDKQFDSIAIIPCSDQYVREIAEMLYIKEFNPRYNKQFNNKSDLWRREVIV